MPLYELFCIASHNPVSPANLRQLVEGISKQIHSSGGVVRDMKSLGVGLTLPMRMRANQQYHSRGDHFTMLFDTSPPVLKQLEGTLRADPLVVRWTMLKKGAAIKDLSPTPDPTMVWQHPSTAGSRQTIPAGYE